MGDLGLHSGAACRFAVQSSPQLRWGQAASFGGDRQIGHYQREVVLINILFTNKILSIYLLEANNSSYLCFISLNSNLCCNV